jgi:hypothetical protein
MKEFPLFAVTLVVITQPLQSLGQCMVQATRLRHHPASCRGDYPVFFTPITTVPSFTKEGQGIRTALSGPRQWILDRLLLARNHFAYGLYDYRPFQHHRLDAARRTIIPHALAVILWQRCNRSDSGGRETEHHFVDLTGHIPGHPHQ